MKFYILILFLLLFSCSNTNIITNVNKEKKEKQTEEKKEKQKINEVKAEELSRLFYKSYIKKEIKIVKENITKKEEVEQGKVNPEDYTVLIDWMAAGIRYVKLKNKKTMNEYVIKEGDTNSTIILVERTLFSYKFKINGNIIEVKRW